MAITFKIVINPKYESLRKQIEEIPATAPKEDSIIYRGRNIIWRADIGGIDATIKSFHIPSAVNRIIYSTIRRSKARRSFDNAVKLQSLEIGTPEPIAYIEERVGGLLRRSYYICRMDPGQNIRHWETEVANFDKMIHAFAGFTLELHQKGIFHKDYSPGNILFTVDDKGKYSFSLIDINRMQFGVKSKRKLYRNFRCLNIDSEEETARVARYYAESAGLNPNKMGQMAINLLRKYHAEKQWHRRIKDILKRQ